MAACTLSRWACAIKKFQNLQLAVDVARCSPALCQQHIRHRKGPRHAKHWDIKFKSLRAKKIIKIDLPDFEKMRQDAKMTPDEMRSRMKKDGQVPPRSFQERPMNIASTGSIFEAYVPPEGDGRASTISKEGAKQRFTELEKKGKSFLQLRKIKEFDEDFDTKTFAQQAQDIYIEAHSLLQDLKKNEYEVHDLVTEKAYTEMAAGLDTKSFRWKFIETVEPPRVVHVRTTEMLSKDNLYGQLTVRLHTKQTLALYDRFGRLMYGSENLVKDVLEYVVFEKHLANVYSMWRLHGKVVPDWMPPRQEILRTIRKPNMEPVEETEKEDSKEVAETGTPDGPQLATA